MLEWNFNLERAKNDRLAKPKGWITKKLSFWVSWGHKELTAVILIFEWLLVYLKAKRLLRNTRELFLNIQNDDIGNLGGLVPDPLHKYYHSLRT
jgi:hypothetical protein